MKAALVYPHQLYANHPALVGADVCFLIEEPLLFKQFSFHSQKVLLHRLSMSEYAEEVSRGGLEVKVVRASELEESGEVVRALSRLGVAEIRLVDPCDDWLVRRLRSATQKQGISLDLLEDPNFLTPLAMFEKYAAGDKKWYFTDFYVSQRKRMRLLVDDRGMPLGGQWSFDPSNRKKLPKGISIPKVNWPSPSARVDLARREILDEFPDAPGENSEFRYPINRDQALRFLTDFLEHRFGSFGDYEDSIDPTQPFLFHSVLTPALNIGLLSPSEVVQAALEYSDRVPVNSLEGFIRQVVGWREYMRGVYHFLGRHQRTCNFWQHHNPMPAAFYDGSTGIEPVDVVIRRILKYAYCHHIERLMVLGNFMLLCEISPNAIYQWFMELLIDAYDWVMVPNVYGMSQFADGGLITTKPYISGSAYLLKMSSFRKGPWCQVWDALYWRFIDKHRDFFASNPRMSVMVAQCNRMGDKLLHHHRIADEFLERLH